MSEDGGNSEEAVFVDSKQLIETDKRWLTSGLSGMDEMKGIESIDQRIASLPMIPDSVSPLTKSGVMISLFYALQLVSYDDSQSVTEKRGRPSPRTDRAYREPWNSSSKGTWWFRRSLCVSCGSHAPVLSSLGLYQQFSGRGERVGLQGRGAVSWEAIGDR